MFFKKLFYKQVFANHLNKEDWLIKTDKTERDAKSEIELFSQNDLTIARISLSYIEGKSGPVGFITFRRRAKILFEKGLYFHLKKDQPLALAACVKTKNTDHLYLSDLEEKKEGDVFLKWDEFYPSKRGKKLSLLDYPRLNKSEIEEIGIMIQRSKQRSEILYQDPIIRELIFS